MTNNIQNKKDKFNWLDLIKSIIFFVGNQKKKYLILTTILFLCTQIYTIAPPFLIGKIVDFLTNYKNNASTTLLYIYIILGGTITAAATFFRLTIKKYLRNIRDDIVCDIKISGFEKLINLNIEDNNESPGALAQKIQSGTSSFLILTRIIDNDIFFLITSMTSILFVFSFLSPKYILFFLAYAIIFMIVLKFFDNKIQKISYKLNKSLERSTGSYVEGLSNILTIKASSAEKSFKKHISEKEKERTRISYEFRKVGINQWRSIQVLNGAALSYFLFIIAGDALSKTITVGSFIIFYGYFDKLRFSLIKFLEVYGVMVESKTSLARMMPIIWNKEKTHHNDEKFPNWHEIKMNNLNFAYKKDKKIDRKEIPEIKNINLKIKKYQKIGIVGKTGSGKSTLAKIMIGLYPINSGEYKIENTNFYDISNNEILKNISIVLQESEMFNMTLRDNITLMRKFDEEQFIKAIQISQIEEIIKKLPQGIDTLIGERGYHLSGGERQRIGIARAIYKNPEIIIFDEATSSLDNKTEKLIQEALEKNLQKKTLIFIAHRLSTLENVDTIYVFENGEITEQGKFNDLLKNKNSKFNKLYNKN